MMHPGSLLLGALLLLQAAPLSAQSPWPPVTQQARPWARWWWMGNAVDEPNIAFLLQQYRQVGLGGVEITPIYGVKDFEDRYIPFLSPDWVAKLRYTATKAKQLDMGVDMNTGTGWPFGGPQVSLEDAAGKLVARMLPYQPGMQVIQPDAQLIGLLSLQADGSRRDILGNVAASGHLTLSSDTAHLRILAAYAGHTLQKVKRAAPGGEGLVADHLSATAVQHYLQRFTDALGNAPVRAFFNDSYEVFQANWSANFLEQFKKDHGYDLSYYFPELTGTLKNDTVARIKADYRATMSNMVLNNFTKEWTNWAHERKSITKNQSHGSPGNILDMYAAVDIPECETFGATRFNIPGLRRDTANDHNADPDPVMLKFASSAAHITGKPLVSSETFTWLTEHFNTALSQCKPEAEQLFLAGINHIFYHGATYSPKDAPWPGWLFYASMNMVPANSLWDHSVALNTYIARCQSVLQAGKPDNDVLLYWPISDVMHDAAGMELRLTVHDIDKWLIPQPFYMAARQLTSEGYLSDFISDAQLLETTADLKTEGHAYYKALIIPACKRMPEQTLAHIIGMARQGATVIFQQLPEDVPGFADLVNRRKKFRELIAALPAKGSISIGAGRILLSDSIAAALRSVNVLPEPIAGTGLQFIRRSKGNSKYYYIVNHTAGDIDTTVMKHTAFTIMDPQTGAYGAATNGRIQLRAGEALILQTGHMVAKKWIYLDKEGEHMVLNAPWRIRFTKGGPALPATRQLNALASWTALGDTNAVNFSGTAEYSTTFNMNHTPAGEYMLDLGQVYESAHVWVNGKDAGYAWSIPFQLRIGHLLKAGANTLKIEVSNLMANRIRYMDKHHIPWRRFHEINFVNIGYKPFDASGWAAAPSGLVGPVVISRR